MLKLWFVILLFCCNINLYSQVEQEPEIEDSEIIGVVKVLKDGQGKFFVKLTYASEELPYEGFEIYDIIIRTYLANFPLLNLPEFIAVVKFNFEKFKKEYNLIEKPPDE
jgi:hypothetical protein